MSAPMTTAQHLAEADLCARRTAEEPANSAAERSLIDRGTLHALVALCGYVREIGDQLDRRRGGK